MAAKLMQRCLIRFLLLRNTACATQRCAPGLYAARTSGLYASFCNRAVKFRSTKTEEVFRFAASEQEIVSKQIMHQHTGFAGGQAP